MRGKGFADAASLVTKLLHSVEKEDTPEKHVGEHCQNGGNEEALVLPAHFYAGPDHPEASRERLKHVCDPQGLGIVKDVWTRK